RADRNREITLQAHLARGDGSQAVKIVELVTQAHGDAFLVLAARSRIARTSSSVVCVKSSYQRPTAWSGSGVRAQITSSTTSRIASQRSNDATGTATTIRAGLCWRSAATAASIVEPVARPSSTRM